MAGRDPRLTPARPDLAAETLRGEVEAQRLITPTRVTLPAAKAAMLRAPDRSLAPDTEILSGEALDLLERGDDWVWAQSVADGYVGYIDARHCPERPPINATHAVRTLGSPLYLGPELKRPTGAPLSFGARVEVAEVQNGFARISTGDDHWYPADHLRPLDQPMSDWVATAEMFLGVPYLWGGRSSFGLDCSALVQLALQAAGGTARAIRTCRRLHWAKPCPPEPRPNAAICSFGKGMWA